jgi:insertion element IS1 protein InsB
MSATAAATAHANSGSEYRAHAREQATFYTDDWEAYRQVIPAQRHEVCDKGSGHTNAVERFNCTLRQRVSRLVRKTLSFSKKLKNHIGAIKYFICHYNQEVIRDA